MNIVYTDKEKKSYYNNIFWLNKHKNKRPKTKQQNYFYWKQISNINTKFKRKITKNIANCNITIIHISRMQTKYLN